MRAGEAAEPLARRVHLGPTEVHEPAAVEPQDVEAVDAAQRGNRDDARDDHSPTWKRNERLVYLTNFLHMTMYTMCLGGVFDIFLYNLSQEQKPLVDDPVTLGRGITPPPAQRLDTYSEFELTFEIMPSKDKAFQPVDSSCVESYTCASSIIHVTDGSGNADCCLVGNRMPMLFFGNGTTQLHLAMDAVGQNETADRKDYLALQRCYTPNELDVEVWSSIKVKASGMDGSKGQIGDDSASGAVMLFVNGTKVCEVPGTGYHTLPAKKNAYAFFGSLQAPFQALHLPANAQVRNAKYGKPASNLFVGVVNSIQGILSIALMYPIGWVGDHMNRYTVVQWNCLVGAVGAVVMVAAVAYRNIPLLFLGICVFTFYQQCISSMINAILADNVPKTRRTRAGVNYKIYSALAMASGPGIQLFVALFGPGQDAWGSAIFDAMLLPGWALLLGVGLGAAWMLPVGEKISRIPNVDDVPSSDTPVRGMSQRLNQAWIEQPVIGSLSRGFVVAASTNAFFIFTLLANGMTVRYFNLYFTQILKFSPTELCLLNAVCRLWIAGFVLLQKPLTVRVGRTNLAVILHLGSALFTLGIYGGRLGQPTTLVACSCYLMRFACLHARDPLLYSLTMDCVPQHQRSRWAALNSLRTLSFSASAVLGGYLADLHGYEFSFDITVVSLLACTVIFLPAWLCFPRSEGGNFIAEDGPSTGAATPSEAPRPAAEPLHKPPR